MGFLHVIRKLNYRIRRNDRVEIRTEGLLFSLSIQPRSSFEPNVILRIEQNDASLGRIALVPPQGRNQSVGPAFEPAHPSWPYLNALAWLEVLPKAQKLALNLNQTSLDGLAILNRVRPS